MREERSLKEKDLQKQPLRTLRENSMGGVFFICALLSIMTTIGIVIVLLAEAIDFFRQVSILEFVTHIRWSPTIKPAEFGVLPLISGTLTFTFTTALIALPVGLLAAIYLSEYANQKFRSVVKPAL